MFVVLMSLWTVALLWLFTLICCSCLLFKILIWLSSLPLSTENISVEVLKKNEAWATSDWKQTWPLPEDVILEGFPLLSSAHQTVDFELRTSMWFTYKEEV